MAEKSAKDRAVSYFFVGSGSYKREKDDAKPSQI
jgi:hypothetical protein